MKKFDFVEEDVDLKDYSTIKIGGKVKYFATPKNEEDLVKLLKWVKKENLKYVCLGNFSNVLLEETYFEGVVIKPEIEDIKINDNDVYAGCGVLMPKLVNLLLDQGYPTLSFAIMIPGTVGGCTVGNAGAYNDSVMNHVKSVKVIDKDLNIKELKKEEIEYSYRYTSLKHNYIVIGTTFEIAKGDTISALSEISERNEKRRTTQPLDKKNVGSIFKNPEGNSAGRLIDELGLKGYKIGGARVSEKHANFIINEDNATFENVINLINYLKEKVKEKYNILLEEEVEIIYWDKL